MTAQPERLWNRAAVAVFVAAALLVLGHLGSSCLWDDETYTAIPAANLLATGHFRAWDGRNLLAFRNGVAVDEQLNWRYAMFDSVVVAGSMALFGRSPWAVRLPFALAGLTALAVWWLALRRELPEHPALRWFCFTATALNTSLILFLRQGRYYGLTVLFAVLAWWAYVRCREAPTRRRYAVLGAVLAAGVWSQWLIGVMVGVALGLMWLADNRRELKSAVAMAWPTGAAVVVLVVPALIVFTPWHRADLSAERANWFVELGFHFYKYVRDLSNVSVLPWTILVAGLVLLLWRKHPDPTRRVVARWLAFAGIYVVLISATTPIPAGVNAFADVRYVLPAFVFLTSLVGWVCWRLSLWRLPGRKILCWRLSLGAALLAVYLTVDILSCIVAARGTRWLLPELAYEASHHYPTATGAVVDYLDAHAKADDHVTVAPGFMAYPLMYHAGDRLLLSEVVSSRELIPGHPELPDYLFKDGVAPEWLVLYGMWEYTRPMLEWHLANAPPGMTWELQAVLPVHWGTWQRPELYAHSFRPVANVAEADRVHIYRLVPVARP